MAYLQVTSARERSGMVAVHLEEQQYELAVRCTVPRGYPQKPISLELQRTNLPKSLAAAFLVQAAVGGPCGSGSSGTSSV